MNSTQFRSTTFNLWRGPGHISRRVPGTRCSKSTGAYAPVAPVLTEALDVYVFAIARLDCNFKFWTDLLWKIKWEKIRFSKKFIVSIYIINGLIFPYQIRRVHFAIPLSESIAHVLWMSISISISNRFFRFPKLILANFGLWHSQSQNTCKWPAIFTWIFHLAKLTCLQ